MSKIRRNTTGGFKMLGMGVLLAALLCPLVVSQALAQALPKCTVLDQSSCPGGKASPECEPDAYHEFICETVPEMSDYLAMAFVLVAGGMVWRIRSRAAVSA